MNKENVGKYPDRAFWLSPSSMSKLRALRADPNNSRPLRRIFRDRAIALTRDRNPQFSLSGQEPGLRFDVGIGDEIMAGLYRVAERFDLPPVAVGELVMSYVVRGAK